MFIFSLLSFALSIYSFIMLARILMSWLPNLDPRNPIVRFLYDATEPVLAPVRRAIPPMSGFDFSPIIVMVAISLIQRLILRV
ncbi:MAG: YggT family protein [Anaerolineae bacterium]|jgi:YggT family protein|nr:YggT family protein [Anaerolineae bacterium]